MITVSRKSTKKLCPRCGRVHMLEDFHRNVRNRDGKAGWCKECTRDYLRKRQKGAPRYPRAPDGHTKRCAECKKILPVSAFHRNALLKDGVHHICKECRSKIRREDYRRRPKIYRKLTRSANLKRFFNMSVEAYDTILNEQGNKCAICGVKKCSTGNRFGVDHNHKTGKVRGLLCSKCNRLLGYAKDDVKILFKAIAYLRKDRTTV